MQRGAAPRRTSPRADARSLLRDPDRRSELLAPDEVRALSRLRPRRVVFDTAAAWSLIALAWGVAAASDSVLVRVLAACLVGNRCYALFIIGHDGMHRRLFPSPRANDLFSDLCLLGPVGAVTRINNRNHLEHHRRLATPEDPDRHKYGVENKATPRAFALFLSGLSTFLRSMTHVFVAPPAASGAAAATGRDRRGARDAAILAGWQAALFGGLTAAFGWWGYVAFWLAPVYVFAFLADNLRSFAEHSHPEPDAAADRRRLITYRSSPVERFFLAPMRMNCHAAHHLWPSIPYYNLARADRAIRPRGREMGLVWRGSYLAYLWRYLRALPLRAGRGTSGPAGSASARRAGR